MEIGIADSISLLDFKSDRNQRTNTDFSFDSTTTILFVTPNHISLVQLTLTRRMLFSFLYLDILFIIFEKILHINACNDAAEKLEGVKNTENITELNYNFLGHTEIQVELKTVKLSKSIY